MKTTWMIAAALLASAAHATSQDRPGNSRPALVTMSGCVMRAATSGVDADRFLLSDARIIGAGEVNTTGMSGLARNKDANALGGGRYLLVAKTADLRPHLGHQMEVTGRVNATPPEAGPGASVTPALAASAPSFQVESLKMVAAVCTAK